jgi:hypothetical protein
MRLLDLPSSRQGDLPLAWLRPLPKDPIFRSPVRADLACFYIKISRMSRFDKEKIKNPLSDRIEAEREVLHVPPGRRDYASVLRISTEYIRAAGFSLLPT